MPLAQAETNAKTGRQRNLAQSDDIGWSGTIVGLTLALLTFVILALQH